MKPSAPVIKILIFVYFSFKESLIKYPHAALDQGNQVESVNRMEILSL